MIYGGASENIAPKLSMLIIAKKEYLLFSLTLFGVILFD
jgi:hypothetical protein